MEVLLPLFHSVLSFLFFRLVVAYFPFYVVAGAPSLREG
jgi:hypothetical protein